NSGYGVNVASGSTIENFNNSGLIEGGDNHGTVYMQYGTIKTFTNSGTIRNFGNKEPSEHFSISSGMTSYYGTIGTFTNSGLISGITGLKLSASTINNFTNTGTIESTSDNEFAAGISISTISGDASIIENLTNSGTIKSNSNGIIAEAGNYINTLINKDTIEAKLNGISFYDYGDSGGSGNIIKLGKIILEEGSSIKAGNNGINIDHGTSKAIEADGIEVKKGVV
ncbi:TPA: autotransporter outer membrane beta-barrel domain-containing protein, partial [Campylobacter jejuni]|nr:autotransporter outer membrane beta-barrel domain-containing protein [Campylobacter jejuni]